MTLHFANRERMPLTGVVKQKFIDADGNVFFWHIHINRTIGEGRSCLCYDVEVEKGPSNRQRMIMKQFYPEPGPNEINVSLHGFTMTISHMDKRPDIIELAKQFEDAFLLQNKLASAIDQVVKPSVNYFDGATKLVLYEVNSGESLDKFMKQNPNKLLEMLEVMEGSAEALHAVHEAGYLHMDLKPENILWNPKSRTVKLFDFDAAICMKELGRDVKIQHDGRAEKRQTLAPELRTFEDKRIFLEPRVDVYSLGCILFEYLMGRCPTDEECLKPESFKDEFHDRIYDIYDDDFSFEVQEEMFRMLSKSISYRIDKRYDSAKEMAEDIQLIYAKIKSAQKRRTKPADNTILAGYVLDSYPVCNYKEKSVMDVTILGELSIRDAFLKHIYACAQMMNTELKIRMIMPDAKEYVRALVEKCPQLVGTTQIYLDGDVYVDTPLDSKITEEPFATLLFMTADKNGEYVLSQLDTESRYFIFVDKKISKNKIWAQEVVSYFADKNEKVFVGYGKRGHGGLEVLTDIVSANPRVHVQAFCCDANMTQREKLFKTDIYRKALDIHTFYTKQWDEKAEKKQIEKDLFTKDEMGEFYNLNSSLRSALAIKYKYSAAGLAKNKDDAKTLYEHVLANESKELYNKLTYLEHRSWMCFSIMQGFRRPTEEELEEYFYRDGNDHRNKKKKLHPCICASLLEPKKVLVDLSFSQWNDEATLQDRDYDELDRLSLKMHQMAEERTKTMDFNGDFEALEEQLRAIGAPEELLQLKDNLQKIAERMLNAESEINAVWKRAYGHFKKMLSQYDIKDALQLLEKMNYDMKVVIERNLFHDYRSSDGTVIEAIPKIVMKREDVYRRIYKTPTKNVGDLIVSTILMEPEELVLLESDQVEVVKEFLENRGLGHIQVTSATLDQMKSGKSSKKMVLDVTGCSEKFMMKLLVKGHLGEIPVIRCENGKLVPESKADEVRYYLQPRHLTVEEMMLLSKAKISDYDLTDDMMTLSHIYKQLWDAYLEVPEQRIWEEMRSFWKHEEEMQFCTFEISGEMEECTTESVFTFLIEVSGLQNVLEELLKQGFLKSYQLPSKQLMEGKILLSGDGEVLNIIKDFIEKLKKDISLKCAVVEKCGVLSFHIETLKFLMKSNRVLESLYKHGEMDGQDYILQKEGNTWKFANQSIKQCLLRKNRLLEVFAYHALLQKAHLDDVKANVKFDFGKTNEVMNEISLVCTKGLQTLFILCTQEPVDKDMLTEMKYYADYFGMNGKAIILSSEEKMEEEIVNRSKAMGVYLLGKSDLSDDETLAKAIDHIANGASEN